MSNLTLFKGNGNKIALTGAKSMTAALKNTAAESLGSDLPEGGVYVSFSGKTGRYSIGTEKEDADAEEIWLVNIFEFSAGWICWKGSNPVAKRMASIYGDPVERPDPSEHGPFGQGEGWSPAKAMMLRSIQRGIQGYWQGSAKSSNREFAKLEAEVARRLEEGLPAWPLIQMASEKFTAQGKTNYKPVIHIAGWLAMQQVNKMADYEDNEAINAALEELVEEADAMEEQGIRDSTMDATDDAAPELNDEHDGIEEAEIVEDEDTSGEAEEEAARIAAEEAAAKAARASAAAKSGGLRRKLGK